MTRIQSLFMATFLLLGPHAALGQTSVPVATGAPAFTIVAGIGNAMGGLGGQLERSMKAGRMSVFGGLGYTPEFEPGSPSSVTGAAGLRGFTAGKTHRAFVEVSVSALRLEYFPDQSLIPGEIIYGPGAQVGYQFIARSGLTTLLSIGTGVPIGGDSGSTPALMAGLGLGFTWRR